MVGVDPQHVVVVAGGIALDRREGPAAVARAVEVGVRDPHHVGVGGLDGDAAEVPAALPDPAVIALPRPVLTAVVGTVEAAGLSVDDGVDPPRRGGGDGDADPARVAGGAGGR